MQFYYNSGIPQRQRRQSRQGGVNKDVPCFLVYPDGSHSLGMISPAAGQAADDPAANQDQTMTGPFIVWADARPDGADGDSLIRFLRLGFYALLVVNLVGCGLILADSVVMNREETRTSLSPPPIELPVASFAIGTCFKLVGAWGVQRGQIRYLSAFIAAVLFLTILSLLWTASLAHMLSLLLDIALVLVGIKVRSSLMGSWFCATR
mmetsp:Transcript_10802/g.25893  ORF Transcript_10802/g.25893 Transcript_10802/m.25893 type:complete len:207 (+) Transcript_10802:130-750(+)